MIGPIFHSPRRGPRRTPLEPGTARRYKNLVIDLAEYALAPLGRWEKERLVVETVEIRLHRLAPAFDGYRIALLTDPHLSPLVPRWWVERAVARTMELGADLIVLGGDYVDDDPHYVSAVGEVLRPLRAPDGVVGVLGNHDHYVDASGVRAQLTASGVRELLNASMIVTRGGAGLAIAGVGDLQCDAIDFARALDGVPEDVPRIVISHDPDVFGYWPNDRRLDLMLSGHTHGGQAWLPLIGPPFVPSQFGFRFLKGHILEGERQLYVSRGVGASGVPIRWKCPPELTLAVLRPSHS